MAVRFCVMFLLLAVAANAVDYCTLNCGGDKHIMCLYKGGPGPDCTEYKPSPFSESERNDIVRRHNEIRSKIAQGKEPGFSSASNMAEIRWDEELATIAQRWADQCRFEHDHCHKTARDGWVGQNLASSMNSAPGAANPVDQVNMWYNEIKDYKYNNGPFQFAMNTGHFTQVAWSGTNRVGCARSVYHKDGWYTTLLVCNYAPGGNMGGQPLYKEGKPCDGCRCSPRYNGLCE